MKLIHPLKDKQIGLSGLFDIPFVIPEIMVHGKVSWWKTNQGFLMERRCLGV
jgi:hypothetical protein